MPGLSAVPYPSFSRKSSNRRPARPVEWRAGSGSRSPWSSTCPAAGTNRHCAIYPGRDRLTEAGPLLLSTFGPAKVNSSGMAICFEFFHPEQPEACSVHMKRVLPANRRFTANDCAYYSDFAIRHDQLPANPGATAVCQMAGPFFWLAVSAIAHAHPRQGCACLAEFA